MAIFKDVTVNITRLTAGLQTAADTCLILTTESTNAYAEYSSLSAVVNGGFTASTEAYKAAAAIFGQNPAPDKVAIVGIQDADDNFADVIDDLNTMYSANNNFRFIVSNVVNEADISALASWAAATHVYYVACISEAQSASITNPANDYVVFMVHDEKETYPDAALVGKCSVYQAGSATWKFKTLNGISPMEFSDQATVVAELNEKGYITYVTKYGLNMTTEGKATSGEYMDVLLGVDWIQENMELNLMSLLVNNAKIPYTNPGIAMIAGVVDNTLKTAVANGIIRRNQGGDGVYTINIPNVEDIDTNKIANREFDDLTWTATLAGAIHEAIINGVVSYE